MSAKRRFLTAEQKKLSLQLQRLTPKAPGNLLRHAFPPANTPCGRTHPRKFQQRDKPSSSSPATRFQSEDETMPSRDAWTLLPADLRMTMHRRCCIPRCASSSTTHRTGGRSRAQQGAAGRRDRVGKVRKSNTGTKGTSCHTHTQVELNLKRNMEFGPIGFWSGRRDTFLLLLRGAVSRTCERRCQLSHTRRDTAVSCVKKHSAEQRDNAGLAPQQIHPP